MLLMTANSKFGWRFMKKILNRSLVTIQDSLI
jgi:hypothetical protein